MLNKLIKFFNKLTFVTDEKYNRKLIYFSFFSAFVSLVELGGISVIVPFVKMLSNKKEIHSHKYFSVFYDFFDFSSVLDFTIAFGISVIVFFIFRSLIQITFIYLINKFSSSISSYLSTKLYYHYINLKYSVFTDQNSSHMLKTAINESANVSYMIVGLLLLISDIILIVLIYFFLILVNWKVTFLISILLAMLALLFYFAFILKTKKEGIKRHFALKNMHSKLISSLGNFKFIKILNNQKQLKNIFQHEAEIFAKANTIFYSFSAFPKFILEGISFSILVCSILILLLSNNGDIQKYVPVIFLYLLALYRLLPAVNRILSNINNIHYLMPILKDIENDKNLEVEQCGNLEIDFNKSLAINELGFSYGNKVIFQNANLNINKNDKVALLGPSGTGKSTFINILLGFASEFTGVILVDNVLLDKTNIVSFRKKIGYIPQEIYLFDSTVAENVAFGRDFDKQRVEDVLKKANLFNELLDKNGIFTEVGDNGSKLSGGQKQRVAIARALYDDPDIIIMDEATSALDLEVEARIMNEIFIAAEEKTLIIITHRVNSIGKFNKVYELKYGQLQPLKGIMSET